MHFGREQVKRQPTKHLNEVSWDRNSDRIHILSHKRIKIKPRVAQFLLNTKVVCDSGLRQDWYYTRFCFGLTIRRRAVKSSA